MNQMKPSADAFRIRRLWRFAPAALWMAVIFMLSSRTGDQLDSALPFFQRLFPGMQSFDWGHFVAYFVLAAAIDYGIGARADRLGFKLLIVALCGLYGISDEYHQTFVGGRMMDPADLRNDVIGAALWTAAVSIPPLRRLWRKIAP